MGVRKNERARKTREAFFLAPIYFLAPATQAMHSDHVAAPGGEGGARYILGWGGASQLLLACVASVSVRFGSKERGTRVKDRAKNGSHFISRAAKTGLSLLRNQMETR